MTRLSLFLENIHKYLTCFSWESLSYSSSGKTVFLLAFPSASKSGPWFPKTVRLHPPSDRPSTECGPEGEVRSSWSHTSPQETLTGLLWVKLAAKQLRCDNIRNKQAMQLRLCKSDRPAPWEGDWVGLGCGTPDSPRLAQAHSVLCCMNKTSMTITGTFP